jgi:hypothetical protein
MPAISISAVVRWNQRQIRALAAAGRRIFHFHPPSNPNGAIPHRKCPGFAKR